MIEKQESITAKLCSFARAYHSIFDKSKIFDDYLAYDMMGEDEFHAVRDMINSGLCMDCHNDNCPHKAVLEQSVHFLAPIPLSREAYTKQTFTRFLQKHPSCQYVICGAGMDTFSFRNDNENVTVFEIDHPDTQKYKRNRIDQLGWIVRDNIHFVSVDFSRDNLSQRLLESGFDPKVPTFVSILGVSYYLTLETLEDTIRNIDSITPEDSIIILDYPDKTTFDPSSPPRVRQLAEMTERLGERMTRGFSIYEIARTFLNHHFEVKEHQNPEQIQQNYFCNRHDGLHAYENIHFVYAQKIAPFYAPMKTFMI